MTTTIHRVAKQGVQAMFEIRHRESLPHGDDAGATGTATLVYP
jgi:hypothetical protein